MCVDFSPIGGMGLVLTPELMEKFEQLNIVPSGTMLSEGPQEVMETICKRFDTIWAASGNTLESGFSAYFISPKGKNLNEVIESSNKLVTQFCECGMNISFEDIVFIEELLIS